MNSASPTTLFARKGKATPTPVPEDSIGFVSGLPVQGNSNTVVLFEPVTPPEGVASEILPEAASMLGIRLSSRKSASHALKNTYPEEKDRPTSAPVAVLPLPDKKSMVVIDNPDAREEPGRSGKSRRIIAALAILAAVLAGAYYFVAKDTQVTRSIITKSVTISLPPTDVSAKASSTVIPVVPETLVTTDEPMVKSPKKPVATTPKPTGRYSVQLGSLPNSRDAQRELKSLRQRHGGILSSLDLRVVPGTVAGKGRVWCIRVVGLPDAVSANRICRSLGIQNKSCLVLRRR